ncbi:MAG: glycosyltransferase family 4 protein [Marinilabiliaceae bacterium]|nr:glycosyltransferase family 4 protein [Marinilabiliaceae bacterium]
MKKIRLLFTINNLETAGMRFVLADIATALPEEMYAISIAVNYLTGSKLEIELKERFPVFEASLRTSRRPKFLYPFRVLKEGLRLRGQFDIAHSFDYASDYSEGLVMRIAKIKWIAEKTNLIYDPEKWDRKLKLAHKIVCLSNAQKDLLKKYAAKIEVIPTGVDESRIKSATPAKRSSHGLTNENIVCISVAHLVAVKGHMDMMQAMIELKKEFPELVMLFVGKGEPEYEARLKQFSSDNGLSDCVRFLGERSDIPELIKMSDFKLLATRNIGRREGFGAVVVEAMACAKPVISTKSGGPEDIVRDGVTGLLVSAEGHTPLVEGIREFLNRNEVMKKYGMAGYQCYREEYTKTIMVNRYQNVYESN